MTSKELAQQTVEAIFEVDFTDNENNVLAQIEAIITAIKGEGVDGKAFKDYDADELSRIAGSLAILKDTLGEMQAKFEAKLGYSSWYVSFRQSMIRKIVIDRLSAENPSKKPSLDDINSELEKQTAKEKNMVIFRKEQYRKISNKLWSINDLLDVIARRIAVLTSNRADAKYYDNSLDYDVTKVEGLKSDEQIKKEVMPTAN